MATLGKFSIPLAHLDGNVNGSSETEIAASLADIQGVEVLLFFRRIPLKGARPQDAIGVGASGRSCRKSISLQPAGPWRARRVTPAIAADLTLC